MDAAGFFLGTHQPAWLGRVSVPLFVSRRRLAGRRRLPRALCSWALDSGGFSELTIHGRYSVSAVQYAAEVRRYRAEVGQLAWAPVQDWMCEPAMLQRTGLDVREQQRRTVASWLELRGLAPDLPWVPVLQGWEETDYLRHVDDYARAGVDLTALPLCGLGSVCRRQDTDMAERLIRRLSVAGIRLHLFGFKLLGLARCARWAASADSMAWSYNARKNPPLPQCGHKRCNNCLLFALWWREKALRAVERGGLPRQTDLFEYRPQPLTCPECESVEVAFPDHGNYRFGCWDCGHSWGESAADMRRREELAFGSSNP